MSFSRRASCGKPPPIAAFAGTCFAGRGSRAGYTLVEMLVVLAIIGLAVSLASLSLRGSNERLSNRTALEKLARELAQARADALDEGVPLSVLIDPKEKRILRPDGSVLTEGTPLAFRDALGRGQQGRATLTFYPDGSSNGGTLFLGDGNRGDAYAIRIHWLTGRIVLVEGEGR